jgi:lathosterol oxidase
MTPFQGSVLDGDARQAAALPVWLTMLAFDVVRYVVPALGAFLLFWVWGRDRFRRHRIVFARTVWPRVEKIAHDIGWSISTIAIYSAMGTGTYFLRRAGVLRDWADVHGWGWLWFFTSVLALIVLQDTYFYWTHRAMHHRAIYPIVHRVHHRSTTTSPFSAYAFHPLEAITHGVFVPLVWLVLPLHEIAVFLFLLFMILRNVHGHLSIELFPKGFTRSWLGFSTTTTHHALHHKDFRSNYGLYFTFWDRRMGTTHADYEQSFERFASGVGPAGA